MTKLILSFIVCIICVSVASAQRTCGNEKMFNKEAVLFPDKVEEDKKLFKAWQKEREESGRSSVPVTIPVHVIVVHSPNQNVGQGNNLSIERINSQIEVLNNDFARTNADAGNTPGVFDAAGSDISFCLSTVDPDGNPTTGVTRYPTNDDFQNTESTILDATMWPPTRYLNIYLAPDLSGLLGYAALPTPGNLPPTSSDAVRILTSSFGGEGFATEPGYDEGRTATHEIGHWLGLRHVWGNGGCGSDDGFDDTPSQTDSNFGCPNHPSPTCNNGGDMFMNYMDYVNDNCMNAFTVEQVAYMEMIIEGTRTGLLTSASTACVPSGAPIINLVNKQDIICSGDLGSIELTATSGTAPYTYSLNGGVAQASGVFTSLPGGDHVIVVTESEGITSEYNFTINAPSPVEWDIQILNEPCAGMNNGAVSIIPSGGNTPFNSISVTGTNYNNDQSTYFSEAFQNGIPADWTIEGEWIAGTSDEVSSMYFTIPETDEFVVFNDDILGDTHVGSGTITSPNIDLAGATDFNILVDAFFRGDNYGGQETATFYVSEDDGVTWIPAAQLQGIPAWITYNFEITGYAGATIKLQFIYDDGGAWNSGLALDNIAITPSSLGDINDLPAGVYNVVATDDANCQYATSFEILETDPITINSVDVVDPSCAGSGSVTVSAASANGIDRYELDGNSNTTGQFDIGAGNFTLIVYDNAGCSKSTPVTLTDQGGISIAFNFQTNVSCNGGSDGEFTLDFSNVGENPIYTINGAPTVEKPYDMLTAGVYEIIVVDDTGCSSSFSVTITEPEAINISADVIAETCSSQGAINFTTTGGVPPFSYSYDMGPFFETNEFAGLPAGNYEFMCRDANGCLAVAQFNIDMESQNIGITENVLSCGSSENGIEYTVELCTSNGEEANWTIYDNQGIQLLSPGLSPCVQVDMSPYLASSATDFFFGVEALTGDGCVIELNSAAIQPMTISTDEFENLILCPGDVFGYVVPNLDEFESFEIVDMSNNPIEIGQLDAYLLYPANSYTISAVDMIGCTYQYEVNIEEGSLPQITVINNIDATSNSGGSIELLATSGTGTLTYNLLGEQNMTGIFTDLEPDSYTVIVTDEIGCSTEITFEIRLESSIEDLLLNSNISLYPNPASDQLFVKLDGDEPINQFTIYGIDGRIVKQLQINSKEITIDVALLESGLYIIEIHSGNKLGYGKFLKE